MDRAVFLDHLLRATAHCREFATQFVVDPLPSTCAFWIMLSSSYDRKYLMDGEITFEDDVQKHGKRIGPLSAEDVVSLLWRDGLVPQWIDISVWDADERATYFELICAGRFMAETHRLYYSWTDDPPFGVKGPVYPTRIALAALNGAAIEKYSLAESRQTVLYARRVQETD